MRRRAAAVLVPLAAVALAACDTGDGRQMDPPDDPLPATTTTTVVEPGGDVVNP